MNPRPIEVLLFRIILPFMERDGLETVVVSICASFKTESAYYILSATVSAKEVVVESIIMLLLVPYPFF